MKYKNCDLNRIEAMIASGQNLGACLEELRFVERRVKELKSRVSLPASAAKPVNNSGKKRTIEWPGTACMPREEALSEDHFDQEGMLSFFGYHVGKSGLGTGERRAILKYLYQGELPRVRSYDYMNQWGDPGTSKRLKKLALSIVNAMNYAKEKSGRKNLSAAVSDWKDDLIWLKRGFFDRDHKGRFKWPVA